MEDVISDEEWELMKKATTDDRYKCSVCGERRPRDCWGHNYFSQYCPKCGAKMDEEDKEENGI